MQPLIISNFACALHNLSSASVISKRLILFYQSVGRIITLALPVVVISLQLDQLLFNKSAFTFVPVHRDVTVTPLWLTLIEN